MQSLRSGGKNRGRALALVPLLVALVLGLVVLPRPVPPRELPLPQIDAAALGETIAQDGQRAADARANPLHPDVRALGAALRAFNAAELGEDEGAISEARKKISQALPFAIKSAGPKGILALRAVQMEEFLRAVSRFESTGTRTADLDELGGTFVRTMMRIGWCRERTGEPAQWPPNHRPVKVLLDDSQRRAAFKQTWNKVAGAEDLGELALSVDETRALYTFYFQHPHAPESTRLGLFGDRTQAKTPEACAQIDDRERVAAFGWLIPKMKELAAIDATYPLSYAQGIALYHRHDYGASAQAFRAWLEGHPDGPWTLRARNYLAAAEQAASAL